MKDEKNVYPLLKQIYGLREDSILEDKEIQKLRLEIHKCNGAKILISKRINIIDSKIKSIIMEDVK